MKNTASSKQKTAKNRLVRRGPSPLALEQRFMFDGAAVSDAIDTAATANTPVDSLLNFATADTALPTAVISARADAEKLVADYLSQPDAQDKLFALFNGGRNAPSDQWQSAFKQLFADLQTGGDAVRVELRSGVELQGAKGAFSTTGTTGQYTIYLNSDWLAGNPEAGIGPADSASIETVLVEELGHSLDVRLNGSADTAGDEGQHFSDVLLNGADPYAFDASATQDDHGTVAIDGQSVDVEFASFTFSNAYEMVYDQNNDTVINTTERWADKEQNLHYFDTTRPLGQVQITDGANGVNFSGNDVSATSIIVGGNTYYGWISRPIKSGGVVRGFYFWTDNDFNNQGSAAANFAAAQADGNQDGDSNVMDNRGFLLVVDQTWFTSQIAATKVSKGINNAKDGNLGTIDVSNVGSSSDRVDSALNNILPTYTPAVALDDSTSGTPDAATAGRPALEQGYNANTSTQLVATIDATGNVLSNDTTNGNTLNVISAGKSVANQSVTTASTSASNGTSVSGLYGSLTIGADGTYRYVVDNSNPTVNALQVGGTLTETFKYTLTDGKGGTSTATLTVQINGSNDAPIANPDYNTAKESTTSTLSGFASTGYSATGNVLPNDTDVDTGDTKAIQGLQVNGQFLANTVTNVTPSSNLAFTTTESSFNTNTISGKSFYYFDGSTYRLVYDATGTVVTAGTASLSGNIWTVPLSAAPSYYNSAGNTSSATDDVLITNFNNKAVIFDSGTVETTTSSGGAKTATSVSNTSIGATVDVNGSITGMLAVGMTLTSTSSGSFTADTKISALTYTSGVLTQISLDKQVSFSSGATLTFSSTGAAGADIQGAHGVLSLAANGSYTYTPTTDNPYLSSGQSGVEVFDYTMQDTAGVTSSAKLYITVYGSGTNDPVVVTDALSVYESGVGRTPDSPSTTTADNTVFQGQNIATSAVAGTTSVAKAITYNVLSNDTPGTGGAVATYTKADGSDSTSAGSVLTGAFGDLTITSAGAVTYTLTNSNSTVNALLPGATLTETFRYKVTNTASGVSWSTLTVTVEGTNDAPAAVNDTITVTSGQQTAAGGNVLSNDTDVDTGDTKTVIKAQAGSTAAPATTVSGATAILGSYGTLTINSDGSYSFAIDENNATVKALAAGANTTETFSYQMRDTNGATSVATLMVTITGRNDAPVNTIPASLTTAVNTAVAFTGGNAISVADADGNLNEVVLHVDHGALSATGSGAAVITGGGTGDLKITGTQTEINTILASLAYTPTTSFYGTDFLSIYSRDSNNAYDSDGFAINIPTNTTATVYESALSTGSNPSATTESYSGSLTLASGQTVTAQSGTSANGTWSVATDGTFTFTLTSAANKTSSPSNTFSYTAYDGFGNAVTNTVTVTIVDDVPAAVADSSSAIDAGSAVTGNVLTDGTADVFGADGAKTTSPVGGVVGVRAAGGNTATEVTNGAGAPITGTYGTLTLKADGSYSYTPNNNNSLNSAQNDVFVYTIEDMDGSRSTTTLTIIVNDASAPTADLVTAKTLFSSDATPNVGDTVTFLITVTNNGSATATNVHLTDQLPSGLTYTANTASAGSYNSSTGVWTIGSLANGASATLRLSATVNAAADGTNLTNTTGQATSDQTDPTDSGNDLTETVVVDKPPVASNDSATFTPGTPTTVDVVANDTTGDTVVAATVVFTSGSATNSGKTLVVAGEGTWSINATTGAITFTPLAGFVANPTAVMYKVADAQGNFATASVTLTNGTADLVTAKTLFSSDATPNVGDTVTFLITVTNNGSATATNVHLTDQLPSGLTYTANTASAGSYNSSTGVWTIGSLANGASATLRLSATVNAAADGTNLTNTTGQATSDQTDPTDSGNDLTETVVVDKPPVASNDSATFTPGTPTTVDVVANDTTGDTVVATTVVFTSGSATNSGKTLVVAGEGTWSINATSGAITFTPLAGFVANPTAVMYKVADAQGNFATASVTLTNGTADLVTAKTLFSSDATPNVGDTVTFLITVTNNGSATATNVHLTDQLPSGLTYTANTASAGSYNSSTGVWTIGSLANGASATLRLSATVNVAADGTNLTNTTGQATSDQTDPTDSGNDLTETVVVDKPPVASNDSATFTPGTPTTVDVVANDTTGDTVVAATVVFTANGGKTLVVAGEGTWSINATTGAITFTPLAGFTGTPTAIEYKVADAQGNFAMASVTLTKVDDTPVPLLPVPPLASIVSPLAPIVPPEILIPSAESGEAPQTGLLPFDSAITSPLNPFAPPSQGNSITSSVQDIPLRDSNYQDSIIADIYTSPTGFRVAVIEAPQASLTLYRGMADQYVDTGSATAFAVPYDAFAHTDPNQKIMLSAMLSDGGKLPEWVVFDAQSGKFTVLPPKNFIGELKIKVTARDSQGREVSTLFRFSVGEKHSGAAVGRQGFSEQLRFAGQRQPMKFVTLNAGHETDRIQRSAVKVA